MDKDVDMVRWCGSHGVTASLPFSFACDSPVRGRGYQLPHAHHDPRRRATHALLRPVACTAASNFVEDANTDNGSCRYDVVGCASAGALNFDSLATVSSSL